MFTAYVTATRDNLSRYFFYSNYSNGGRMGRKLVRRKGIRGNLMHENGLGVESAKARTFFGSELKESQPQDPGAKPAPGTPGSQLLNKGFNGGNAVIQIFLLYLHSVAIDRRFPGLQM
jgi:hypothetical protein